MTNRTRTRFLTLLILACVIAACGDSLPTGLTPELDPTADPQFLISDASHSGNEHFFWLPPMVGDPTSFNGNFDASLSPNVTICDLSDCQDLVLVEYSTSSNSNSGSEVVRVVAEDEHYIVNWHVDEFGVPGPTYRVIVSVEGTELGFADVQLASSGKEAKNLTTNDMIGLKDGRTLPIKFRIEEGAKAGSGPINLTSAIAADFDGDGRPDIAGKLPVSGRLVWFRNRGHARSFESPLPILEGDASADLRIAGRGRVADLDGDGDPDLLLLTLQQDEIAWLENRSGGSEWVRHVIADGITDTRGMEAADLDQDGSLDVVAAAANGGTVGWYRNQGAGVFGSLQVIHHASWPQAASAEDLDGDGDLDVISASERESTGVQWYSNQLNAAGGFGGPQAVSAHQPDPSHIETGDIDGDGDLDIVTRSARSNSGQVSWYENRIDANQGFVTHAFLELPQRVGLIFMRDLDGDGDRDLVVEEEGTNAVVWYENGPTAGFGSRQAIGTVGSGAYLSYPVDLDHDGDIDVLALDTELHQLSWFENPETGAIWIKHPL